MAPNGAPWRRMAPHGAAKRRMAPHGAAWRRMAPHGALAPLIFFVFSLPSLYKCHLKNINSEIRPAFFLTFLTGVDGAATPRFWLVRPARHRRWWRAWSIVNLYQVCAVAPATPMLIPHSAVSVSRTDATFWLQHPVAMAALRAGLWLLCGRRLPADRCRRVAAAEPQFLQIPAPPI